MGQEHPGQHRNGESAWMAQKYRISLDGSGLWDPFPPAGPCLGEQDPPSEPGVAPGAAVERSQIPAAQLVRNICRGLGNPRGGNEGIISSDGNGSMVPLQAQRELGELLEGARLRRDKTLQTEEFLEGVERLRKGKMQSWEQEFPKSVTWEFSWMKPWIVLIHGSGCAPGLLSSSGRAGTLRSVR